MSSTFSQSATVAAVFETLGMDNATTLEEVQRGYRMPKPVECPSTIYDMMLKCWDKVPDRRPTFDYLHKFFDDFATESGPMYE